MRAQPFGAWFGLCAIGPRSDSAGDERAGVETARLDNARPGGGHDDGRDGHGIGLRYGAFWPDMAGMVTGRPAFAGTCT